MWLKLINLLTIIEILSLIGSSFSATLVDLTEKTQFKVYNRLKYKNYHRGVLLSLSADQKNEICQDAFSAQLYVAPDNEKDSARRLVRDTSKITYEPEELQHELMLGELSFERTHELRIDLIFRCVGHFTRRRIKAETSFYVSTAHQPKWFYSNFRFSEKQLEKNAKKVDDLSPMNYILISPDFVEQVQLEQRFVNVLLTIKALRAESPGYVGEIEKRDIITSLSKKQKQILCASIMSSPIYRKERLEFYAIWLYGTRGDFEIEEKSISLRNPDPTVGTLSVRCIRCKGKENETDPDNKSKILYLTSSYDDEYSIIVLKEDAGGIFIDKYFKNIPLFIAAGEDMNYDHLFLNYV